MIRTLASLAAALTFGAAATAHAAVELSVTGEARQEAASLHFHDRYQSLAGYLGASIGTDVKLVIGRDPSRELQKMRAGMYEVLVGPAHVIGAAMRYGYEPVARFAGEESAAFVASKASGVKTFEAAKGKRLALPPTDSLATYLARGELNAKGVVTKEYFADIREHRYHEVALMALDVGQADIAVAESRLAKEWAAKNGGTILLETRATPGLGIAVNAKLDKATKDRIRAAFLSPNPRIVASTKVLGLDVTSATAITAEDYKYVSTLGYFTPRTLPGATVVTAPEVADLLKKGGTLYDTRSAEEYNTRHIQGAKLLPYGEKSRKEVGFDDKADTFDVTKLPADKNAPVVFACNGAECWKSYKASLVAVKAGHKQVYWFRGGFPEWNLAGLPTQAVPGNLAKK
ncbi:MAG TPA: PhnD/SsuA/transferrin family substrate-binding protein [Usitatibacteraceae bacterium]|nr:PhnD/SsuA/transferrin family substrate-binding protein [Usitatibacteraceae bacterium]